MTHTPGPWHVEEFQSHPCCFHVTIPSGLPGLHVNIASVEWNPDHPKGEHRDLAEANVRLIAVAPDQHQALLDAPEMDAWRDMTTDELRESVQGYVEWFHGQRAAVLAKAEGNSVT